MRGEVRSQRRADLDEAPPSGKRHLARPADDTARTEMAIERHLDDKLPLTRKLLRKNCSGALVGMTVGVVEDDHGALQQARQPAARQPVQRLPGCRCAIHPRRGNHDHGIEVRSTSCVTGVSIVELQSMMEMVKCRSRRDVASR